MSVGEICNRNPVIIGKSDSIYHAAELMRDKNANYIIVVESRQGENIPIGITTERDIVVKMVAERLDLDKVTIGEVMQPQPLVAHEDDHIAQTVKRMRHSGVRCLPIINADDVLIGILSIDDILDKQAELLNDIGHILTRQQTRTHEQLFVRQS